MPGGQISHAMIRMEMNKSRAGEVLELEEKTERMKEREGGREGGKRERGKVRQSQRDIQREEQREAEERNKRDKEMQNNN